MTNETITYSVAEAAAIIPCHERWLLEQLRARRYPGRWIYREWRMTRADIDAAIEIEGNGAQADVPKLYSLAEASEILGCTDKWLGNQMRARRFTGTKIGGHWRMTAADITAAIEICRPGPKPEPIEPEDPIVAGLSPIGRRRVERNRRPS